MKTLFIETRRKFKDSEIDLYILDKLPGQTISLAATVQYLGLIPKVKEYLESKGKTVQVKKGAYHEGHVLGCNSSALDKSSDTLLLITDGKFHAMNNAIQLQREIYVFTTKTLEKVEQEELSAHNKKTRGKQTKFIAADTIGLLISSKHGQHNNAADKIKEQIEKMGKKVYVFEAGNINTAEFENFPQIKMWVNTACFGLGRDDMRIVNLADVVEFLG